MKYLDTHNDLVIQRHQHGIKLIRSKEPSALTVSNLFKNNFNIYLINAKSEAQHVNDQTIITSGWDSERDIRGKTVVDVWGNTAPMQKIIINDKLVYNEKIISIEEEDVICHDKINHTSLSIKFPWYNTENNIIGLLGCTLVIGFEGYSTLPDYLSTLMNFRLLDTHSLPGIHIDGVYLSKREKEILALTLQGKTAKKIALLLGTSFRTVEHQLDHLKIKFDVKTKSELIEKIYYFLFNPKAPSES